MYKNFFITGYPGSGKTTIFNDIVTTLKKNLSELPVYGFITKEIRKKGIRVGFSIENFYGEKGTLSHIDHKDGPRVGKYGVDLRDLKKGGNKYLT